MPVLLFLGNLLKNCQQRGSRNHPPSSHCICKAAPAPGCGLALGEGPVLGLTAAAPQLTRREAGLGGGVRTGGRGEAGCGCRARMAAGPGGSGMLPFLRLLGQLKVGAGPRGRGGGTGKGASLPGSGRSPESGEGRRGESLGVGLVGPS